MCWMTIQKDDEGNAPTKAVEALRIGERRAGGHSWGLAIVHESGKIEMHHGIGEMPAHAEEAVAEIDATLCLGHTRLATRGSVSIKNAHPFAVRDEEGDVVAALAHNGTWYEAPQDEDRADSYYIARLFESFMLGGYSAERALEATGEITGETLVVVTRDGEALTYSGRMTITMGDSCVCSSGEMPLREGKVVCL